MFLSAHCILTIKECVGVCMNVCMLLYSVVFFFLFFFFFSNVWIARGGSLEASCGPGRVEGMLATAEFCIKWANKWIKQRGREEKTLEVFNRKEPRREMRNEENQCGLAQRGAGWSVMLHGRLTGLVSSCQVQCEGLAVNQQVVLMVF